jgi:hypothetical protein
MSKPAQLIINGIELPFTSRDKYRAYMENIGESARMITGRLVRESRAQIWVIDYSYDYFQDELLRRVFPLLCSNEDLTVDFLTPDSEDRLQMTFACTQYPSLGVAFARGGKTFWHNLSFKLESVEGAPL